MEEKHAPRTDEQPCLYCEAVCNECRHLNRIERLGRENAELLEALKELLVADEHKLKSLEKKPYAIGLTTVRARVEKARTAIARATGGQS